MPISKTVSTLVFLVLLLTHGRGVAQDTADELADAVCPAPISLCRVFPDTSLQPSDAPILPCPPGSTCTCVPSCPGCLDCPVRVCVPNGVRDCDICVDPVWLCDRNSERPNRGCGDDRVCSCTASCPLCLDCGPPVCVPRGAPVPYRCDENGGCANSGDKCVCASSAPHVDDCPLEVCVPDCDAHCKQRVKRVTHRINRLVRRASRCHQRQECVRIDTTTECVGTCGAWVNQRYAEVVKRAIDQLDEKICSTYQEDGCPFATPACQLERGACVRGHCVGVPVSSQPIEPDLTPRAP